MTESKGFVSKIEEAFGKYRAGMRKLVLRWAWGRDSVRLDAVYVELIRVHDGWRPPTLAKIMQVERDVASIPPFRALPKPDLTTQEREEIQMILEKFKERMASLRGDTDNNQDTEEDHGKDEEG